LEQAEKERDSFKKRVEELESEKQAAKRRVQAEKLIKEYEARGKKFETEEEKNKELERLAILSEGELKSAEDVLNQLPIISAETKPEENLEKEKKSKPTRTMRKEASLEDPQRCNTIEKINSASDRKVSFEEELGSGILGYYQESIGSSN